MDSIQSLEFVEFCSTQIQSLIVSGRKKINILHSGDAVGIKLSMFLSFIIASNLINFKYDENDKCRNDFIKFVTDDFTIQIINVEINEDIISDGYVIWMAYGSDKYQVPRGQGIDCSWTFSDNLISNL